MSVTMSDLNQTTARALVESGYMPVSDYLAAFGKADDSHDAGRRPASDEDRTDLTTGASAG